MSSNDQTTNEVELTVERKQIASSMYHYLVTGPNTDEIVTAYDVTERICCTCEDNDRERDLDDIKEDPDEDILDHLGRGKNCEHKQAVKKQRVW